MKTMRINPRKRIYLAGPDVFLPNAIEIAKAKQEICFWRDFTGVSPSTVLVIIVLVALTNYD